jgi:xanthosine utilization system XapX-like protein
MIKQFINLEWKSFFRAAAFKQNLFFKIFIGFFAVLFLLEFAGIGAGSFFFIEEMIEDGKIKAANPLEFVNQFLIYWFVMDLFFRYMIQKMPVANIKPLLYLPFTKGKIVKSAFFFVPFTIVLLFQDFSVLGVISWHLSMLGITLALNFLNIFLNNTDKVFYPVVALVAVAAVAQYYGYFDITLYTAPVFDFFYEQAWSFIIPVGIAVMLCKVAYDYFLKQLYLDAGLSKKVEDAKTENLDFLNRFGKISTYLKNDIKLIKRNKRARTTFIMGFLFIFYGLLFTSGLYGDGAFGKVFAALFCTGGFLFSFGGLVPSWDSSYYKLMMSQNIPYREFLLSKWWLMVIVTAISTLLSVWYVYFGVEWLYAILAGAVYNIGFNSSVVLLGGAYVKTPIDLTSNKKAFGDSKAFNAKTLLLIIPKLVLPVGIYYAFALTINDTAGFIAIALTGVLGMLFRNRIFVWIENIYKSEKYDTIAAYSEKN